MTEPCERRCMQMIVDACKLLGFSKPQQRPTALTASQNLSTSGSEHTLILFGQRLALSRPSMVRRSSASASRAARASTARRSILGLPAAVSAPSTPAPVSRGTVTKLAAPYFWCSAAQSRKRALVTLQEGRGGTLQERRATQQYKGLQQMFSTPANF